MIQTSNAITIARYHDDVIKLKHFLHYWPIVRGIHRSPVNSPHKGQWSEALMFSLICALNKRLSKQPWGWWFETQSRSLWRHCNDVYCMGFTVCISCAYHVGYIIYNNCKKYALLIACRVIDITLIQIRVCRLKKNVQTLSMTFYRLSQLICIHSNIQRFVTKGLGNNKPTCSIIDANPQFISWPLQFKNVVAIATSSIHELTTSYCDVIMTDCSDVVLWTLSYHNALITMALMSVRWGDCISTSIPFICQWNTLR